MISLYSPAKLNLFLKVVQKREDGYHELASLFQTISLFDKLHVSLADKDSFTMEGPYAKGLPVDDSNLVVRALNLFKEKTKRSFFVSIHLEKYIPIQAGLGGGSSNAATTLWALNELLGRPASLDELILWSEKLGSDTTFFLSNGTAYCTGRGEVITPLAPLVTPLSFYVIKPSFGLSTPLVFKALDVTALESSSINAKELAYRFSEAPFYFNDLEKPAFQLKPELKKIKEKLVEAGFSTVLMTGSGTSFFVMGEADLRANFTYEYFPVKFIHRTLYKWYEPE